MKQIFTTTLLLFGLTLLKAQTLYSEDDYKKYFIDNIGKLDPIEGIWSVSFSETTIGRNYKDETNNENTRKVVIIKSNYNFELRELNSSEKANVFFESTSSNVYLYKNVSVNATGNAYLKNQGVLLEYERTQYGIDAETKKGMQNEGMSKERIEQFSSQIKILFSFSLLKVFPTAKEINNNILANQKSSGTGFAINSGGLIATNYHVIENAKKIHIKGINGDYNKSYVGIVVASDKNNDLAIIKITDGSFTSLGVIPYLIKQNIVDIGTAINVLGYPLITTMGEEIKYTNGTISSKSGFQGDITSYQISAPIQPGNSGAPLFDKSGNIIGVVNAKHLGAENVGYAIKLNYLLSLIETLPAAPKLQTVNNIFNKSLPEQIKAIKNFVYIIEIN